MAQSNGENPTIVNILDYGIYTMIISITGYTLLLVVQLVIIFPVVSKKSGTYHIMAMVNHGQDVNKIRNEQLEMCRD